MQVHETAFIISTYRSYHEEISQDFYSKLWNNDATEALIPEILESVSQDEAVLHSLRNRFFYEQLSTFFKKNNGGTLINFGSGFSMYQFALDKNVTTIEIDKKDIITYKKEKVEYWTKLGKLPDRDIQYISIDFNTCSVEEVTNIIKPLVKKQPTFILLEGVLFFLNKETSLKLFRIFNTLQNKGDRIGSVSYLPEIENTEVYKRLLHYFDSNNDTNDSFNHQTIPNSFYGKIKEYTLKNHIDEFELAKIYAKEHSIISKDHILNENMYVLEKL
ncbi:class I SAM-dependent methyltransferase [Aquimarina algicola]|uniref:Class I SAM-dependent methyltransferase n=1 Tax=Aquimarina algicola TaxID=2589995 RepID=A0A504J9N9_9FLAO|nr:class I SAM-dependent methyltransferase [Aquimarina algicola]TPN84588.1 class I SAM-dependent methyltransferase [Aquimarina algicola]